jgi:hypothetical protein
MKAESRDDGNPSAHVSRAQRQTRAAPGYIAPTPFSTRARTNVQVFAGINIIFLQDGTRAMCLESRLYI